MALSAILLILVLAIGFFQSIGGLFSALINCVLAVLCAAFSLATYEYVAANLLAQFKPDYALGLALVGMFIIPLAILRVLLDKFVHRACLLPMIVDKSGGFIFGLAGAYVMVGMLALGLQLVPFGNGFLGFTRVDRANPTGAQNELWLSPDRFAVSIGSMLSAGVLSGENAFHALHPDLVTEIGWTDAVPFDGDHDRRGVRRYAPPGAISVVDGYQVVEYVYKKRPGEGATPAQYEPRGPESGKRFIKVQFRVDSAAGDIGDKQHRYTPFQIRLVGDRGGNVEQYHAIAIADDQQTEKPIEGFPARDNKVDYVMAKLLAPDPQTNIAAVFEVPERFTPKFIEYKGGARAALSEGQSKPAEPAVAAAPQSPTNPTPPPTPPPAAPRPGGERVGGVRVAGSFFGDNLPVTMTDYIGSDTELDNAKQALKQGHLRGNFADQGTKETHPPVARFEVAEGKRMLHLNMENLRARSSLGRALSFAVKTMQNYLVHDDAGREYKAVGLYAIAKVDQTEQVEVIYFPEYVEVSSRGLPNFSKIKDSHLQGGDYTYVFLYLIEPGARLVRFSTGARASSAIDLKEFNLVAPP